MEEETVMCTNCNKKLSGNDPVFFDVFRCPYCSKECLIADLWWGITTVQKYIEED